MARALWTGSLSFGLVNVPVSVVTATRDLDLHFRQLHHKDGAPIDVQRWCSKEDVEISYDEITHGYELEDGGQVVVSDLELQAIEPHRTRTIDIEQFVDLADVDPIYFDHPYFLVPAADGNSAHQKSHKPTRKQLDAAVAVIEELTCDWDPDKHKDRYRARLKRVVDRKRKGKTIMEFPRFCGHLSACVCKLRKDGLHAEVSSAVSA